MINIKKLFLLPEGILCSAETERQKAPPDGGVVAPQSSSLRFPSRQEFWHTPHAPDVFSKVLGWDSNCIQPRGIRLPVHNPNCYAAGLPERRSAGHAHWGSCDPLSAVLSRWNRSGWSPCRWRTVRAAVPHSLLSGGSVEHCTDEGHGGIPQKLVHQRGTCSGHRLLSTPLLTEGPCPRATGPAKHPADGR